MSTNPKEGREALRVCYSDAAKNITELYRNAVVSYDAGYRDALLYIRHYVLLSTPGSAAGAPLPHSEPSSSLTACPSASPRAVDSERLLRFIQGALRRHDTFSATSRGLSRRRKRCPGGGDQFGCSLQAEGDGLSALEDDRGAPRRRMPTSVQGVEEYGAEVGDMLSDIRISKRVESESGTSEDGSSPEM